MPPEVCHEHDLPIDEYGCWACGHGGPITDTAWPSWKRWADQRFDDLYGFSPSIVGLGFLRRRLRIQGQEGVTPGNV